jgi:CheY-like chemotaxis protein
MSVFEGKAGEKGIELIKNYHKNHIPNVLIGDSVRLNQILYNLISNAIKFTSNGTVSLTVKEVIIKASKSTLEFTISDTGIGIAQEKHSSIFNAFSQANDDTTRKFGGTGLGLSIVKQLVEIQGGRINIKSDEGKGASFIVELEFEIGKETDLLTENKANEAYDFSGLNVLLVEDNVVNQLVATDFLESKNCVVTTVSNGKEAIDILEEKVFELILMDMQMPVMDGYTAIEKIRNSNKEISFLPIVALTAHTSQEARDKCIAIGADEYLSKPYSPVSLYNVINTLLTGKNSKLNVVSNNEGYSEKVNYNFLLDHVGGNNKLADKILAKIKDEIPKDLKILKEAIEIKDWVDVTAVLHKVKPSVKMLGNTSLHNDIADLETHIIEEESMLTFESRLISLVSRITIFFN